MQLFFILNDAAQFCQLFRIVRLWYPQFQVATLSVFAAHMLSEPLVLLLYA